MTSAGDSAPVVIAKGAPLATPDGIVVTKAGVIYVSDQTTGGPNLGSVFKGASGTLCKIADNVRLGQPGGVALTPDDAVLLVSSIDRDKGTDQVLLIELGSLQTGLVTKVVGENHAAGGVHRGQYNESLGPSIVLNSTCAIHRSAMCGAHSFEQLRLHV